MFTITYQNVLKKEKNCCDFTQWIKTYWPVQKKWGALSVVWWNEEKNDRRLVFCRYTVQNIDCWNRLAIEAASSDLTRALNNVVDLRQTCIKITNWDRK